MIELDEEDQTVATVAAQFYDFERLSANFELAGAEF